MNKNIWKILFHYLKSNLNLKPNLSAISKYKGFNQKIHNSLGRNNKRRKNAKQYHKIS